MSEDHGHIMLVESVARPEDGWAVDDVLSNSAKYIGDHVSMLPDGEIGDRYYWINYVARRTYAEHPDMSTLSHHSVDDWKPKGYDDHWLFTIKDGVKAVHFDEIGYAHEAKKSYAIFKRLREEGVIPRGVRFMVAIPLIESATRPFIDTAEHFEMLWNGYGEAIRREVADICASIPHEDLALQWDICVEVAALEGLEGFTAELDYLETDPMKRYCNALKWVCEPIPDGPWLGLHICYGSLSHQQGEGSDTGHFCEIKDLNVSVDMANEGVVACGRSVQFIQVSVQLSNGFKEAYYTPLERLDVGDARTYLGLIHLQDGVDGALERMDMIKKYLPDFGISTQCGWGRRPLTQKIEDLLDLHRQIGAAYDWPAPARA